MTIKEAQQEVRRVFLNGAVGQSVSSAVWLLSAALGTWGTKRQAMVALVIGGMFIFLLTQLLLRLSGRPSKLSPENPLGYLAMQVAFIIPLILPVAGGAVLYRTNWFYPAVLIIVGAHYLPFVSLYGMWQYAVLAGVLVHGGLAIGLFWPQVFALGGWFGGAAQLLFVGWVTVTRRAQAAA